MPRAIRCRRRRGDATAALAGLAVAVPEARAMDVSISRKYDLAARIGDHRCFGPAGISYPATEQRKGPPLAGGSR